MKTGLIITGCVLLIAALVVAIYFIFFNNTSKSVDLFVKGEDGYHTYRIPSLYCTDKGTLLAFAEGRVTGSADMHDTDLVMRRSTDDGKSWSEMTVLVDNDKDCCSNPTPVQDLETGRIFFFYVAATAEAIDGWEWPMPMPAKTIYYISSDDDGLTWSEPVNVTEMISEAIPEWDSPGPSNGLQIMNGEYKGRLVIPMNGHVLYSDDHGATWIRGAFADEAARNETTVAELSDGTLIMNTRSDTESKRLITKSTDGGATWAPVEYHEGLVDTGCQGSQITYVSGNKHYLIFANATEGYRRKITVKASSDDGETYSEGYLVYEGFAAYSGLTGMSDNRIGFIYENGTYEEGNEDSSTQYEKITFTVIKLKDIL